MPQEDVESPRLPPIVGLLYELQVGGYSVNWDREQDNLRIVPEPDTAIMVIRIKNHYDSLKYLLPGHCDACLHWHLRRHEAYWAAHPHLCGRCLHLVIARFRKEDQWPEGHFEIEVSDGENPTR
jgi:hypothetical protein